MPFVSVRMTPKTPEQVAKMSEGIAKVIMEACNVKPEHVWIVFEEIPTEHWAIGGHLMGKPQEKKE
jgi:4-oxalocrotonate tautomerase family enzyme